MEKEQGIILRAQGGGMATTYNMALLAEAMQDPVIGPHVRLLSGYSGGGTGAWIASQAKRNPGIVRQYAEGVGFRRSEYLDPGNISHLMAEFREWLVGTVSGKPAPAPVFGIPQLMDVIEQEVGIAANSAEFPCPVEVDVVDFQRGRNRHPVRPIRLDVPGTDVRRSLASTMSVYPYYHPQEGESVDPAWTADGTAYDDLRGRFPDDLLVYVKSNPTAHTVSEKMREQIMALFHGTMALARYPVGPLDVLRGLRQSKAGERKLVHDPRALVIEPDLYSDPLCIKPEEGTRLMEAGIADYYTKLRPQLLKMLGLAA